MAWSMRLGRQLAAVALIYALLLQGFAFALDSARFAAAAGGADGAGFELCHHDDDTDGSRGPEKQPASDRHCIFCLAGVTYLAGASGPAPVVRLLSFAVVPWPFVAWRLSATTVDASTRPRGPPPGRRNASRLRAAPYRHSSLSFASLCGCALVHGPGGFIMSRCIVTLRPARGAQRRQTSSMQVRFVRLVAALLLAAAPLLSVTTTARACACGCSVFDVGGGMLPQENDHGGRVFFEWWHSDQNQNWIGGSKGPASANSDKHLVTDWYTAGFMYMFNREWGMMMRIPYTTRSFTTDTNFGGPPQVQTFNSRSVGDIELTGIYTGFDKDMSAGIIFGLKLPTGTFREPNFDRDNQIGSGSTDLILGAFKRGMITGDNAWQYFAQVRWLQPFLFQSAFNPDTGTIDVYKPSYQIDSAAGIVYNNLYNVLGFDKITPLVQVIGSVRGRDGGPAADPLNTGFERLMFSPGIEFTKVLDEPNSRVLKVYFDVEVPFYYRVNAAPNDSGSQGQLISPIMYKLITSYNF
jgi:hypothetical protein